MYSSFAVRNFRGFREARVSELAPINLITGLNDAGKTSLLEAMFLHACGPLAAGNYLQTVLAGRHQGLGIETSSGSSPWRYMFRDFDETLPCEFFAHTSHGDLRVEIVGEQDISERSVPVTTGAGASKNAWSAAVLVRVTKDDSKESEYHQSISVESTGSAIGSPASTVNVSIRLEPPTTQPFTKAAIVIGNVGPDLAQGYSELRRSRGALDLLGGLQGIDPRITGLEVLVENGLPQLHAEIENKLVPFELLGEGVGALAKYLLSMLSCRNGLLLIDEVGAGVHHSALPQLWNVLWRAAERLNVQIVATTHSDECVRAAEEALRKRNRALIVHRLRRGGDGENTKVISYSDEKLQTALTMNVDLR